METGTLKSFLDGFKEQLEFHANLSGSRIDAAFLRSMVPYPAVAFRKAMHIQGRTEREVREYLEGFMDLRLGNKRLLTMDAMAQLEKELAAAKLVRPNR